MLKFLATLENLIITYLIIIVPLIPELVLLLCALVITISILSVSLDKYIS